MTDVLCPLVMAGQGVPLQTATELALPGQDPLNSWCTLMGEGGTCQWADALGKEDALANGM